MMFLYFAVYKYVMTYLFNLKVDNPVKSENRLIHLWVVMLSIKVAASLKTTLLKSGYHPLLGELPPASSFNMLRKALLLQSVHPIMVFDDGSIAK